MSLPLLPESDDYKNIISMVQNGTIKAGQRGSNAYMAYFDRYHRYGAKNFQEALKKIRISLKTVAKHVNASKYWLIVVYINNTIFLMCLI
jgi:hypothetical protein